MCLCPGLELVVSVFVSRPGVSSECVCIMELQAKVVNEAGEIVPRGVRGQLLLKGHCLFLEYKDRPDLTKEALTADGWLKTG